MPVTLAQLNALSASDFIRLVGHAFEHSPWIAETAARQRPFGSLDDLHRALCETVRQAGEEKQLALIRAHPDLVGSAALTGTLTPASTAEQAAAGLSRLTPEELAQFRQFNAAYRERFGFPFVICARISKKETILAAFPARLRHDHETEVKAALEEIYKIAYFRLLDIVVP